MRYVQKFTHWLPLWPLQPGEAFLASGGFFAAAVQQQNKETVTAKEEQTAKQRRYRKTNS